ncbi:peptidoglycan D,D-transpeptidase FtsI family protein [Ruania alba]|uniref:Cell elongation-specific peptidoglycan D,D-transpeptidase n=1 Tax=Ruania alba TaxID=648782 RepID=A0A1H5LRT5_9MICO|nr:penicillin-binding protein 2 [Ruania alba]SEE79825.1 cell elongation-specific peptidoglycan D,D-transpeptidase [Ruania alba]
MNTPLRRLSVLVIVMFFALMGGATWVQFFQASELNADSRNVRTLYRDYGRDRGPIVVDGEPIAASEPVDDPFGFQRVYPNGPLYAPVTGWYGLYQLTGLERSAHTVLNGTDDSLLLSRIRTLFTGAEQGGGTVELTIDPAAQQAAWDALDGRRGAAVALDPETGAILAMVSRPSYDPNVLAGHSTAEVSEAYTALVEDEGDPLFNRTIGGNLYAPGSTFKLIDLAMLLESGEYQPDTEIEAPTEYLLPGTQDTRLRNPGGGTCGGETVTLEYALQESCNTPFAMLAVEHGAEALRTQAEAFGFGEPLTVPMGVTPSQFPADPDPAQTAMSAIGQFDVRVTPLQMAMVSAAVANDGQVMRPHLIATERGPDLQVTSRAEPEVFAEPISASTAATMTDLMVNVVANGTGAPGQIAGVDVAGKTGTAETGSEEDVAPDAWFTAFAPAEDPQVVVAVVVEDGGAFGDEGTGASVAAPVARQIMQAVLEE